MKKYFYMLVIILLTLSGCASYSDINEVTFTSLTLIDVDDEGNPIVYMECFSTRYLEVDNSNKGARIIYTATGKTISDAIQTINESSRQKINPVYSKIIIFTDKAAKKGLDNFFDVLVRDQEFLLRSYVVLSDQDPEELLTVNLVERPVIGLYMEDLFRNEVVVNTKSPYQLFDYMNIRESESSTEVMGILRITNNTNDLDPHLGIKEAGVIKDDKLVDKLTEDEFVLYNMLMERGSISKITVPHPENDEKMVTLKIMKGDVNSSVVYSGKSGELIQFKKKLKLKVVLCETQASLDLTDESVRAVIEKEVKEQLELESQELYEKFKVKNIDIFQLSEEFKREYPKYKMGDIVEISQLEVEVKVRIDGSPNTQNFQ